MAITHLDANEDNIKRAKTIMAQVSPIISDNNLWDDKMLFSVYDYMNTNNKANTADNNTDVLGYIDNIVERLYQTNYTVRLQKALAKYNETNNTSYTVYDLANPTTRSSIFQSLIAIDPILTAVYNKDFTQPLDDSIASVDIYEDGGNNYGR
jgi:hypothetical protein